MLSGTGFGVISSSFSKTESVTSLELEGTGDSDSSSTEDLSATVGVDVAFSSTEPGFSLKS